MPTPIDRAMQSRNMFLGFAGLVTAVAAWSIWGGDMFPSPQPKGDPETWSAEELRNWLRARNLNVKSSDSKEELVFRVRKVQARLSAKP